MSWMGNPWDQEWQGGEESNKEQGVPKLTDSLKPLLKKPEPIKLSTRWHAFIEEDAEEEEEDWEKEEASAMWNFQGRCDAAKILHERETAEKHRKSQERVSNLAQTDCYGSSKLAQSKRGKDNSGGGHGKGSGDGELVVMTMPP